MKRFFSEQKLLNTSQTFITYNKPLFSIKHFFNDDELVINP